MDWAQKIQFSIIAIRTGNDLGGHLEIDHTKEAWKSQNNC